ncbi:MAG: hypothetical protein EZS28_003758 [Streblomastix strix]|uniref:Radial spoke head 1 n=1 Tax=Streblomastix strix TaxID=222440 RepID=A0A5J4X037_9EUKA|nr:MAG: hypothetical protein EZS28_003758 [Streblomastix strix]
MAEEEKEREVIQPEKMLGVFTGGRNNVTGEREGPGENRFPNGDVYKSEYQNGQRNGPGKYFWKVTKYVGCYMNHIKDGYGLMKYPDGSLYDGRAVKIRQ